MHCVVLQMHRLHAHAASLMLAVKRNDNGCHTSDFIPQCQTANALTASRPASSCQLQGSWHAIVPGHTAWAPAAQALRPCCFAAHVKEPPVNSAQQLWNRSKQDHAAEIRSVRMGTLPGHLSRMPCALPAMHPKSQKVHQMGHSTAVVHLLKVGPREASPVSDHWYAALGSFEGVLVSSHECFTLFNAHAELMR